MSKYIDEAVRRTKTGVFVKYEPQYTFAYAVVSPYAATKFFRLKENAVSCYLLLTSKAAPI